MFIGHWDGFCREELGCESFTKIGMSNILAFLHLRISISRHENMPCYLDSRTGSLLNLCTYAHHGTG